MLSEDKVSSKTLKGRVDYILENRTLKQLIENRNRYDIELSLKTNLYLFDEDWMFVEKKVEGLVATLKNLEQNPNIHCNNCKDISAQNLLSWLLVKLGAKEQEKKTEHEKPKVIILDNNPLSIASYLEEFGTKEQKKETES